MIIKDKIYGEFEVEKVLEELIHSKPVQRLKGIHQGGASYLVNNQWNVTRYDHSIGVMLLIRKLGGSVEEQIAGLLHDVSHTAFSHVVDYVFKNKNEDYHEMIYSSVIFKSEIPEILAKFGYHYEDILLDDSKWTLLEQPAPELCADRVDYTLRDMFEYGQISLHEGAAFLKQVVVVEGKMYLKDLEAAQWFVSTYYKEVIDFFMDPLNVYGNDVLAQTLKLALDKEILTHDDFLGEDEAVIEKLTAVNDQEIQAHLRRLHQQVRAIENEKDYDIYRKGKVRLINPSVFNGETLVKASQLSNEVKKMNEAAYAKSMKGSYIKVLFF
ncbi:HD domain-containing protein [Halobacillus massiliensis]|uniref:HD domain-containing protein n=1 Tax=Halobacillus massiliensis TaxID=1926286 RepID=UPI0009E56F86|nr:HD domain-containing protein [Halobacillus massiliensis]